MKITVIIPIFRVEHTIERCVDSVLRQTFSDWEMILVDDGSDDCCPQLCDAYAAADSRIHVIHQANRGLGAARNSGIDMATGDSLMFIDSDDALHPDTLTQLSKIMEQHKEYDFVEFPIFQHYGNPLRQSLQTFTPQAFTDKWDYWFNAHAYQHSYACNKIFRARVFHNVRFCEGKKFEDLHTLPHILNACSQFATTDKGLYLYYDNANGITSTAGKGLADLLEGHIHVLHDVLHWQYPTGISHKAFATYYAHVLNIQIDVSERCGTDSIVLPVLPYWNTPKLLFMHIFGIKALCKFTKTFHKLWRTRH
jgi:glycosyltransferase involved in cell wall biosynthesis